MKRSYAKHATRCGSREEARTALQCTPLAYFENTVKHLTRGVIALAMTACFTVSAGLARAAESTPDVMASARSLDEQVQEVKSDILAIAAELSNLEERLLYPSNTQVAVFVSLADGQPVALDSARISIDGELVTQHIYSFKELEALEKGGVQRIYTGNVKAGEHRLEVSISGTRGSDKNFETVESFVFKKEVEPKLVGITLAGQTVGNATIAITDW